MQESQQGSGYRLLQVFNCCCSLPLAAYAIETTMHINI
jgi:hypothetical protein